MLIDLHCHTKYSHKCSTLEPNDLIRRAADLHLDGICITDHNYLWSVDIVKNLTKPQGLQVFVGVEVDTVQGQILVFGIDHLQRQKWHVNHLVKYVNDLGGICISCHSFRLATHSIGHNIFNCPGIAAVETLSGRCKPEENNLAFTAAEILHLPTTGGSDCHTEDEVGYYLTEFDCYIKDIKQLIIEIKAGRCSAVNPREG